MQVPIEISRRGNVKFIMSPEPRITMTTAIHRSTSIEIEVYNGCKDWLVYQFRTNCPRLFILKPCASGILGPRETEPMRLYLLPGHSYSANYQLLFEATLIPNVVDRYQFLASVQFRLANKEDISRSLISVQIVSQIHEYPKLYQIHVKEAVDIKGNLLQRAAKVAERLQREDLMSSGVVLICMYVIFAFLFGYLTRSFKYPDC